MSVRIVSEPALKTVASVADTARLVGLSRARFYQLQKAGIFPPPVYDLATRRPVYTEEQQQVCLEVRRRNCGLNGRPILFYSRRSVPVPPPAVRCQRPPAARRSSQTRSSAYPEIASGIRALGLPATDAQVTAAVAAVYPGGIGGMSEGEVIRAVFLNLRRQNSADNVRR
ncbi:MAG: helix-turn-helix transcriptional regulator [Bacillota bacterium]